MNQTELTDSRKAAAAYDAAARDFDAAPLGFWSRHGCATVDLLDLQPGDRVLDVGCGTGASALPAASIVGPAGHVTGIDIAAAMLKRAEHKAAALGLDNLELRQADMTSTGFPDASFDAVVSVFSLFFVDDMKQQVCELWRMLKPGGKLAVTVWAEDAFQPGAGMFQEEFSLLRPDLPEPNRPWQRLTAPYRLERLLSEAIACTPEIHVRPDCQKMEDPDDWWAVMLGSGYRWYIEQLTPAERTRARNRLRQRMRDENVSELGSSIIIAIARKR